MLATPKVLDKSVLRNQFPPKSWIVLTFDNPPDVLGAVFGFVHEVPASVEEGDGWTKIRGQVAPNCCKFAIST